MSDEQQKALMTKAQRALVEWDRFGGDDYDDVALAMDALREEIRSIIEGDSNV